jgi:hypothetical protein
METGLQPLNAERKRIGDVLSKNYFLSFFFTVLITVNFIGRNYIFIIVLLPFLAWSLFKIKKDLRCRDLIGYGIFITVFVMLTAIVLFYSEEILIILKEVYKEFFFEILFIALFIKNVIKDYISSVRETPVESHSGTYPLRESHLLPGNCEKKKYSEKPPCRSDM